MNYYAHHIGDYAAATGHLSWDEDMAYTRLLRAYYLHERGIPEGQQYRLARASTPVQRKAVDTVLAEFFKLVDGEHRQKRADDEVARFQDKQRKAKASAEHRWSAKDSQSERNANASPNAMRTHSEGNAPNSHNQDYAIPDGIAPSVATKPRRPTKKAPSDFELNDELRSWAAENTPGIDPVAELAKLKDHTFATARVDWPGTLRNWLRKAHEDAAHRPGQRQAPGSDEPEWRRLQRERNEAFLGPAAARRTIAAGTTGVAEIIDVTSRLVG